MCISHNDGQRCCNIIHQFHTSSGIFWGDFWLEMFCGNIQKRLFFACFCCFDRADGSLDFSEKEKHDANFPMTFCRAKRLPFGNGILRWGYEKNTHTHTHTHTHKKTYIPFSNQKNHLEKNMGRDITPTLRHVLFLVDMQIMGVPFEVPRTNGIFRIPNADSWRIE